MRVAVHFPAGHPAAPDGGVVAYKLGRIRDGIDNHVVHTGETVPLDEFTAGLVAQAQAEYPGAEVKVERLVTAPDGQSAEWVAAEDFNPEVHEPAAAGESVEHTVSVAVDPAAV